MRKRPQRILVKEVNWLGDLVMSLPALWAVRHAFRDAHLSVLVRSSLASFFDGLDWLDEVLPYTRPRQSWARSSEVLRVVRALRARDFELGIAFPRSFSSALWLFLARIPCRAGVSSDARRWLLTRPARVDTRDPARHQRLAWLEMLERSLSIPEAQSPPTLSAHPAHVRRMRAAIATTHPPAERLVILAPGAAYGPAKQWPLPYWVELVRQLKQRKLGVLFVGAASETGLCRQIAAQAGTPSSAEFVGRTSIGELAALLSLADAFVGNDSGTSHLAAALGTPTVAIFGSTNPRRTAPQGPRVSVLCDPPDCSPCLARTCPYGHYECLHRVQPQQVLDQLAQLGAP